MKHLTPLNQALNANMLMIEYYLSDMLEHIQIARHHIIDDDNRNAAIGTLLADAEGYAHLKSLYDICITLHRNAELIERHNK